MPVTAQSQCQRVPHEPQRSIAVHDDYYRQLQCRQLQRYRAIILVSYAPTRVSKTGGDRLMGKRIGASQGDRRRLIVLDGPRNFRDIGGYPTDDGQRTRWGRLYRSDALWGSTPNDIKRLRQLGVITVVDLRSSRERDHRPCPLPAICIDLMDRQTLDPAVLSAVDTHGMLRAVYVDMLEQSSRQLGQVVSLLATPEHLPAVVHCAIGKDRTGLVMALVLTVLGVRRDVILDDYAASATHRPMDTKDATFAELLKLGLPAAAAVGVFDAPPDVMAEVLTNLTDKHGSIEGYLLDSCMVDAATFDALRSNLLEPDTGGAAGRRARDG